MNICDAVLTHSALESNPGFVEGNPIMRWVIGFGWPTFYVVKIGLVSACAFALYRLWHKHRATKYTAWFAMSLYILVVCWNLGLRIYVDYIM
jgi:hypothetical protein